MKYIIPDWPAPKHVHAFTTTREAFGEVQTDKPDDNRVLRELFHLPNNPVWLHQTHSNLAIEAKIGNEKKEADASYALMPNAICIVLTADCLPILICDQSGTQVAAIHAGWRGLAKGIIANTLHALPKPSTPYLAWLGPAIGPKKFEVGRDVLDAFVSNDSENESAFSPLAQNKWLANLYELARLQLLRLGIHHIYGGQFCTYSQEALFYSYRRDKGKTGRMASLIWIEESQASNGSKRGQACVIA